MKKYGDKGNKMSNRKQENYEINSGDIRKEYANK